MTRHPAQTCILCLTTQKLHHTSPPGLPLRPTSKQCCMIIAFLSITLPLYMFISLTFHAFIFLTLFSVGSVILARCGDHRAGVYRFGCGFGLFVPAQCHHDPVQPRFGDYGLHPLCTLTLQSHDACPPQ